MVRNTFMLLISVRYFIIVWTPWTKSLAVISVISWKLLCRKKTLCISLAKMRFYLSTMAKLMSTLLRLLKQNTVSWVAYKPQKFTAHSSKGIQDERTYRTSIWSWPAASGPDGGKDLEMACSFWSRWWEGSGDGLQLLVQTVRRIWRWPGASGPDGGKDGLFTLGPPVQEGSTFTPYPLPVC